MAKKKGGMLNLGLGFIIDLILAIFVGPLLAGITRIMRGHLIAGILCLTILAPLFWIVDIITILTSKDLTFFA